MRFATCIPAIAAAAAGTSSADLVAPPEDYRAPVIAKLQVVYSMVSHHHHLTDRINFYNNLGEPKGSANYAVPMLVYEPRITLYNPYHENLIIPDGVRIRIWDPPVGFRFRKIDNATGTSAWLRPAFASGHYQGLSHLNIRHEADGLGRKTFTLHLTDGTANRAGNAVALPPGHSRTYAMRTEVDWTWALENANPWEPRCVFDWNWGSNLTNIDNRTKNQGGVEVVPGWDFRGGFRTDHLSLASGRPADTHYSFEKNTLYANNGWVTTRLTDSVGVGAAPVRTASDPAAADFQIDLMPGRFNSEQPDIYKKIRFNLGSLVVHGDPTGSTPAPIERVFNVGSLLQAPNDRTPGGKTPFAVLTAVAKPSALVDGSLGVPGSADAAQRYDFRFDQLQTFFNAESVGSLATGGSPLEVLRIARLGENISVDLRVPSEHAVVEARAGHTPDQLTQSLHTTDSGLVHGPEGIPIRRLIYSSSIWPDSYFIQFSTSLP